MTSTQYSKPVADFLESIGVTMTLQGPDKVSPPFATDGQATSAELSIFPRKKHIHGDRWMVSFTRGKKSFTISFWDSYRDAELRDAASKRWQFIPAHASRYELDFMRRLGFKTTSDIPKLADLKPTSYDVLACLTKYDVGTFVSWASEMGYGTDSRKALALYLSVQEEFTQVRSFFSSTELETLQEIAN